LSESGEILRLELRPSWRLALLIAGLHTLAAGSVFLAIPGLAGTALGALLGALGLVAAWDRALLRGRRSPRAIVLPASGPPEVEAANGTRSPVGAGSRTVNRFLVTLPLEGWARRSVLVTRDMLGPAQFRRLRLWALWGRLPVACAQLSGTMTS
jgi:hypothetical protein